MPDIKTHADSLRRYLSGASSDGGVQTDPNAALGNNRSSTQVGGLGFSVSNPISNITILYVGVLNGIGAGTLTATGSNEVKWTPIGGGQGAAVTIANGETKIIEGSDPTKFIEVTRTTAAALSGTATVTTSYFVNNVIGFDNTSAAEASAGDTEYRALFGKNDHASASILGLKIKLVKLGTQVVSGVAQLGGSGAGTIKTASNFNDWPTVGYALVKSNVPAVKEVVYYSSRTADELTVPAAGRGLQGTSATAGAATDTVDAIPGMAIAKEAPGSQPSGSIQTIANESTAPTGLTWSLPVEDAEAISIGDLPSGHKYGVWERRQVPAGAVAVQNNLNMVEWFFDAS